MGRFCTIVIEHNWKIRSSKHQSNGLPGSYEDLKPLSPQEVSDLPEPPLAAHIRITVPQSIAQLVNYYNSCPPSHLRTSEIAVKDVLSRLEHLV